MVWPVPFARFWIRTLPKLAGRFSAFVVLKKRHVPFYQPHIFVQRERTKLKPYPLLVFAWESNNVKGF